MVTEAVDTRLRRLHKGCFCFWFRTVQSSVCATEASQMHYLSGGDVRSTIIYFLFFRYSNPKPLVSHLISPSQYLGGLVGAKAFQIIYLLTLPENDER